MRYTLQQIQALTGAQLLGSASNVVTEILYDSRRIRSVNNVLFIAISGKQHNGHEYIAELLEKGVQNFLVEYVPEGLKTKANFLLVPNTLQAFQLMAAQIRVQSKAQLVGITGSNGKTIVKEWLAQILKTKFKVCKNPKSYNSQLGVPLSVCGLLPQDEFGVFEAGISEPGEMQCLENIISPNLGIFTNIGSAHQENFNSLEQKVKEKAQLFANAQQLVFCYDHTLIRTEVQNQLKGVQFWNWSFSSRQATVLITQQNQQFILDEGHVKHRLFLPFTDAASIENALHVAVALLALGLSPDVFFPAFEALEHISMRLEMKKGRAQTLLINDAYSNDLESLKMALEYFVQQSAKRQKILVLSDIEQSGLPAKELYQKVAHLLLQYPIDELITVGNHSTALHSLLPNAGAHYANTELLLAKLPLEQLSEKAILLKGARKFSFEQIERWLEEKSHETVLEVNLARMVDNLNFYRKNLKPGVKTMIMVKAFGYGAGAVELASMLQFHKVDYLAVAYADEGVSLRKAGISVPIMVLNTEISALSDFVEYNLEPEVYSFRILDALTQSLKRLGLEQPLPIHLKLETGMHRLGFEEAELSILAKRLSQTKNLRVKTVFSHLATADDAAEQAFTEHQILRFEKMSKKLEEQLGYPIEKHLANSSAINAFPHAQFNMVRLGIGLYGISPNAQDAAFLKPISKLKATVSQIKHLSKGDSVGYGRAYTASKQESIAIISIGYADGFRRSLGGGVGEVSINGNRYPVVGRVCMDMCMVRINPKEVHEGDEVEIFGELISLYEMAEKMQTIPYEVLTSISERVKRVYLME